jgi:hypothetical protein
MIDPKIYEVIAAVHGMQAGSFTDEQITDQVLDLFPNIIEGENRKEVLLPIVTAWLDERTDDAGFCAIIDHLQRHHPEVIEAMEKDRTLMLGPAMERFGLLKRKPGH